MRSSNFLSIISLTAAIIVSSAGGVAGKKPPPSTADVCASGCPYNTIQGAINDAVEFATITVDNGIYPEDIDFLQKSIIVESVNGPAVTIIHGTNVGSVVTIAGGQGNETVLNGFTVENGKSTYGGGIYIYESSPTIENCWIRGNESSQYGGGIYCQGVVTRTAPVITNCLVSGNLGWSQGTGMWFKESDPTIINCTIAGQNSSGGYMSTVFAWNSNVTMTNSIIWGNYPFNSNFWGAGTFTYTVQHSNIENGWDGEGNIIGDPLFVDLQQATTALPTTAGDYHLSAGSPSIDTGTDDAVSYPLLPGSDMEGTIRPQGDGYDMGAYEQSSSPGTVTITEAVYDYIADELTVQATSQSGSAAALELVGYDWMQWRQGNWTITVPETVAPSSITVCGHLDGCFTVE